MLKKVVWPAPIEINGKSLPATIALLEIAMCRDVWRQSFEMVVAADAICDELLKEKPTSVFTRDQHEKLLSGTKLEGQNISPPQVNQYYFKILRAIHVATDTEEG